MSDLLHQNSYDDSIKQLEYNHKKLNLLMSYYTVFASQKKEFDLQTKLMDEIKKGAMSIVPIEVSQ